MKTKTIVSDVDTKNSAILGTFEGECADSNITNLNGLDITREVWENVFASEEYKQGIENGWFFGFAGHPEDPSCQEIQNACMVMTDGWIDGSGKIYGKFNLIDTPVGRIVKTFIDAGVTFGISVRGAGDIINNSVDPETFVFRGFDLVAFPAFPESIPTFTEIAASSDIESQKKYKAICAAVDKNIGSLNTVQAVEVIQACFAKQSDEYKKLEKRKSEISNTAVESSIEDDRVAGLTDLYLQASEELKIVKAENEKLHKIIASQSVKSSRKMKSIKRIMCSQMDSITSENDELLSENDRLISENETLENEIKCAKKENLIYKRKIEASRQTISDKESKITELSEIVASTRQELEGLSEELDSKNAIISSQCDELSSKDKILASRVTELRDKDSEIEQLHSDLDETVRKHSEIEASTSNLDEQINELTEEITAAYALIEEYQNAYARMYANAIGIDLSEVSGSITASTTVSQLQKMIGGNTTRESRKRYSQPVELPDNNGNSLITL